MTFNGSSIFKGGKKKIVGIATLSLFSIGIFGAGLFAYQHYAKSPNLLPAEQQFPTNPETVPNLISKDEAIHIAKAATGWEELKIDDYRIETALVHVKENGFAFLVDEKTMQNTWKIA